MTANGLGSRASLQVGDADYTIYRLDAVPGTGDLPFSLKILLENLLRNEDGRNVTPEHVTALAQWDPKAEPDTEIAFTPARVILQDLTGVPAVVDLATMREAMRQLGGDPARINPLVPAELVIDHSVVADVFGRPDAFDRNVDFEFQRNRERFAFLRWGQEAFRQFKVVPPGTGIVHQVNIEHLARVVMTGEGAAYPDTCVGTDSHTTMQNGLGVLGWGVGGIEAEAAMLGQPISMLIPKVVGFRLTGELPDGATATDLVLTITELLRKHGVVGKFVEFYGDGVASVPVANRATIGNMSPEFGSTCAIFPIDAETLTYLRLTGRPAERVALVEAYAKEQGLWHDPGPSRPLLRGAHARPVHRGPLAGRPEAAAGPGGPGRRQGARSATRSGPTYSSTGWTTRSPAPSRHPTRSSRTGRTATTLQAPVGPGQTPATTVHRRPSRSRSTTGRGRRWITGPSSSRPSRRARTRRTPPSWSARPCSPGTRSRRAWPASPG